MVCKGFALVAALLMTAPALAEPEVMRPIDVNGYQIVDAEYLPFIGNQSVHYPADVLWGFYPSGASAEAKACALASFRTLTNLLSADTPELRDVVALGGTPRFVLWINDYSHSAKRPGYRAAHLWHFGASARDYTLGSWTWETTLTPSGSCVQPDARQVEDTLRAAHKALANRQKSDL